MASTSADPCSVADSRPSAPPPRRGGPSVYDNDRYWFPAMRHNGRMTIGFVGGHVVSTRNPLADPSSNWEYHPEIGGSY